MGEHDGADVGEALAQAIVLEVLIGRPHVHPQPLGALSPSRVRNADQVLSQILAAGVEGGRIARNPAAGVRLPRIVRRDMHFLTAPQVEDLAAAIDPRYELLVRFAAYTGLRAGELVALRVRHLNLLRGRCEVGESATEVDGRLVWGPTKTYARRTVPLPRFLCEQLAAYLAERPHGPEDLVFTAPQGGPLREQKFVAGIFKPAAVQAGLPHRLRFHDLRHTCASLLIAQGRQRQGCPGAARPCLGNSDAGPLWAPVPRRAPAARRPPAGGLRRRRCGPSTDRGR
jgi:integrase